MMILGKGNIILTTTTENDPELIELLKSEDILYNMSEKRLYTGKIITGFFFRIEVDGIPVGEIALKNIKWFNRKGEISFYIGEDYQNKGYAGKALKMLLYHSFNRLNFHRIEAETYEFNKQSIRLLEKAGFILEGRARKAKYANGEYIDILYYGLLKEEYIQTSKGL